MCDIATALMVASTMFSVYSSVEQGKAAKSAAKFNAREGENRATERRNQGTEKENALRRKNAELIAKQRAKFAAGNINIDSGSALQTQQDTALYGEVDALRLRSNTLNEAGALDRGASMTLAQGNAQANAYNMEAAGSVLSTAGKVAEKWYTEDSSANSNKYVGDIDSDKSYDDEWMT